MALAPQLSASILPSAKPISVTADITLQPPLSRRGEGPGLLVIVPKNYTVWDVGVANKTLDAEPLQKWAEEGFAVAEVKAEAEGATINQCEAAISSLIESLQGTPYHKIGVVGM